MEIREKVGQQQVLGLRHIRDRMSLGDSIADGSGSGSGSDSGPQLWKQGCGGEWRCRWRPQSLERRGSQAGVGARGHVDADVDVDAELPGS